LEGSRLPVTPLRTRSPITPSPGLFNDLRTTQTVVDVDWRILPLLLVLQSLSSPCTRQRSHGAR
jgi:hypothetical protein